ncbi:hypothetical protein BD769DRAFT_122259 [Suillus cothurnatus]|nr:hypothetical protein BD769DRAFT_122259 [Suillus cothurnatus]
MPGWILPGPPSQECGDAMCARERKGGFQDCFASIQNYIRNHPLQRARYGGWRITAAGVRLLVEVKRFPSRSSTRQEQESLILGRLAKAKSDLIEQSGHLFLQDTNMESVLTIAATGPYWSRTTIDRGDRRCIGDINTTMHRLLAKDPSYLTSGEQRPGEKLKWNNALRLDIPHSRDRLSTIYNTLKNVGVLGVPTDV